MFFALGCTETRAKNKFLILMMWWGSQNIAPYVLNEKAHQACTGTKKTKETKAQPSPNLHRHQKNQRNKKTKNPNLCPCFLTSCCSFPFFLFFWRLRRFGASSGLFFCFLVPAQVCWAWLHKTLAGTKKPKKPQRNHHQTCTGTKKTKKNKKSKSTPMLPD